MAIVYCVVYTLGIFIQDATYTVLFLIDLNCQVIGFDTSPRLQINSNKIFSGTTIQRSKVICKLFYVGT